MSFYYNGNGTGGEWGMENGDWRLGNGRTYRWPWGCIPERGHRPQTIRLQTLDGMDFMYHSGVSPFLRSGKGGKRRGQSAECSSCQMTQKGKFVTLTLYLFPEGQSTTLGPKGRQT